MTTQQQITRTPPRSRRVRGRAIAALAAVAVAASVLVPGAQAAVTSAGVPTKEYIPFVTDFPKPEARTAAEEYIPFVTDFPKTAVAPAPGADETASPAAKGDGAGSAAVDVAVGVGIATALGALAASGLVLIRRVRPVRS